MVPQDESVSGVTSALNQEVGMGALPSGAGLEPVSAVGVAEGCACDIQCSFSTASIPSAATLPVFQTGEETSSRSGDRELALVSSRRGKEPCVSQDISRLNNSLGSYRRDRDPTSRARYCFPTT